MPDETDAKKLPLGAYYRRPPGRPHTMWMKIMQQDLESNKLFLNEAIDSKDPAKSKWMEGRQGRPS